MKKGTQFLKYLNTNIESKSRPYKKLKISKFLSQDYGDFSVETAKMIAKIQTQMVETVTNEFSRAFYTQLYLQFMQFE